MIEHDHVVADLKAGGQVVGDVDNRDAKFLIELLQVAEDRRPQRGIHHRDRFIGNDQLGLEQQRPCHHDALSLPTAHLVWIAAQGLFGAQADSLQHIVDQLARLAAGTRQFEFGNRLGQHMIDFVKGVVDAIGILENELHIMQELAALAFVHLLEIAPIVEHFTVGRHFQAQKQTHQRRLATAALPHHRCDQRWTVVQRHRKIFQRNRTLFIKQTAPKDLGDVAKFD